MLTSKEIIVKKHLNVNKNIHTKWLNDVCHVTVEEDKLDAKLDTKLSNFQAEVTRKTINE